MFIRPPNGEAECVSLELRRGIEKREVHLSCRVIAGFKAITNGSPRW